MRGFETTKLKIKDNDIVVNSLTMVLKHFRIFYFCNKSRIIANEITFTIQSIKENLVSGTIVMVELSKLLHNLVNKQSISKSEHNLKVFLWRMVNPKNLP